MNSLQQELDNIYKQLEHLEFRKAQLEPIISEYNDVISRVKSLTDNMIALNIEPTNLRYDIEDILNGDDAGEWVTESDPFKPEATPKPAKDWADEWVEVSLAAHNEDSEVETSNHSIINSYIIPFDPAVHGDDEPLEQPLEEPLEEPEPTPQPEPVTTVKMFAFVPVASLSTPEENIKTTLKQLHENGVKAILKGELLANHFNSLTANELEEHLEKIAEQGLINLGDSSIALKFPEPEPPSEYQLTNTVGWQYFAPRVYFKDDTLKLFLPRKSRYRKELEAIAKTCGTILMIDNKREVHEVGDDWIVVLNPVYDCAIQAVIDEFYPTRKDWTEPTPAPTEAPKPELQRLEHGVFFNDRAFRQGDDILLLGFTNKRLMNAWAKWFKSSWGDRIHTSEISNNLDNFNYCLTVLWYGQADWERLTGLDYSLKPTEQNKKV